MRFDLTDEQRSIKQAVRDLCQSRCDMATVRRIVAGSDDGSALWDELAAAGWTGLCVPEEHGGQGLGVVELSLVTEELGYALAPATFLGNAAAGLLIAGAASDEQRARLLPGIASGERRAALGILGDDGSALALDAQGAAVLVLASPQRAVVVDASACTLEPVDGIDLTRRLSRIGVPASAEPLPRPHGTALDRVEVILAAELVGVAQHAMDLALAHAKQRQQFGRPIGAYQAVSHRCVDMLLLTESARSAVLAAAWTADHEESALGFAASVAKASAGDAGWRVGGSSLQVHGGIGFTWEHDLHLLLRRAESSSHLLGGVGEHLDRAAGFGGLDRPAA